MRQNNPVTSNNPARLPLAAQLLDQVYDALLHSDYGALPALSARLEAELQSPTDAMTQARLALIHRKADRNAACLLAAKRGIRAAQRRLSDIRTTASGLVTYDRSGHRAEVSESRSLAQRL